MKNRLQKILAGLLAVLLFVSSMPFSALAAPASDIPADMLDNPLLDALAYTGYDVQAQKDNGTLYQSGYYGSHTPSAILSGIGYSATPTGYETVTDSSTSTGYAPNIAYFKNNGLVCASFVTYVLCNYYPNIEGANTQAIIDAMAGLNSKSTGSWQTALENMVNAGSIEKIGTNASNVDRDKLTIGDVIIFGNDTLSHVHIGLFAGTYNGQDYLIHVGNDNGPEINLVSSMALAGDKASWPNAYYHIYDAIYNEGTFKVNKKDTDGNPLAGAMFIATNTATQKEYYIGPTDANGYAFVEEVPFGTYKIKETVFPSGFQAYGASEWTVTLDKNTPNGTVTVNAVNQRIPGSCKIVKTSEDGKVAGISFRITGNGVDKTVTTDSNGTVTVDNLRPATYTVTESAPAAYVQPAAQTVTVSSGETATVSFYNQLKRGNIRIVKTSEDGKVSGISFRITGNGVDKTVTTDSQGAVTISNLLLGTYTVTESTPAAYVSTAAQSVTVKYNETATVSFNNQLKRGNIRIVKTSEDGKVGGISFRITGNGVDKTVTTNDLGEMSVSLPIGTYTVTESTPAMYVPTAAQTVTVKYDETATVSFYNQLKRGTIRVVKTSEDNKVSGISFRITGNGVDKTLTTNAQGELSVSLPIGTYTVTESTPAVYVPTTAQTVTVKYNETSTVSFYNQLKRGNLTVVKTSEDGLSSGMRFHLSGTSTAGIAVNEYATTDASGHAYFKNILIGTNYVLEEVDVPVRYTVPAKQNAVVEWNKETKKYFHNVLKKWKITVQKRDSSTGTAQGDATLVGAVYGVYDNNVLKDTYTTNSNGEFTTKEYLCGANWTIKEITPSVGYLLDNTVYPIAASAGNFTIEHNTLSATVREQVITGNILLIKSADKGDTQIETPESGAVFEIYRKAAGSYAAAKDSEKDRLVTDENGMAAGKYLPYGVYTVHQIAGAEGHKFVADFDVHISTQWKTYVYNLTNPAYTASVRVIKKDIETGKAIPLSGFGFQIKDRTTGELVEFLLKYPTPTVINEFYTAADGTLMLPDTLPYGDYELLEIAVPIGGGYLLDTTPVVFHVPAGVELVEVVKNNAPQKGTILLEKWGEVFAGVQENDGKFTPVYEVAMLAGAEFDVIAVEDIVTADGTVRVPAGEVAATLTTSADKAAVAEGLYLGRYQILERKAPIGMVLNGEPIEVILAADSTVETVTWSVRADNVRQKAAVSFTKQLEEDSRYPVPEMYKQVQFGLFAEQELTATDGSVIPADGLLAVAGINADGEGIFDVDLPLGSYYVREISTDEHYVLEDMHYPFTFADADDTVEVVTISVNDGTAILNVLKKWTATVQKQDADMVTAHPETTLVGAVYGVYFEDVLLDTYTTDENGQFVTEEYPCGDNWTIKEITPSVGYQLDTTVYSVGAEAQNYTVEHNAISMTVTEQVITGRVEIHKTMDAGYQQIPVPEIGAVFEVYRKTAESYAAAADEDRDTITTDAQGVALSKDLPYGVYVVHQTAGAEGHEIAPDFEVTICEQNAVYITELNNAAFTAQVKITKMDSETDKVIPLAGFGFQIIETATGETVTFADEQFETVDVFYTTADGTLLLPQVLPYGSYQLVETVVPETAGYVLDATPVAFDVTGEDELVEVIKENKPQRGTIALEKWGEVFAGVQENEGKFTPLYEEAMLSGAEFDVIAAEDIVTADGTIRVPAGEVVATLTTTADKAAVVEGLYLGRYQIFERKAPIGMVLNAEPITVELRADAALEAVFLPVGVDNVRQKAVVSFTKKLEEDSRYILTEMYKQVQFGLFAEQELTAADGSTIPADGLLAVAGIDADGKGVFEADLPLGSYYVREISAGEHYVLEAQRYLVTFANADGMTAVVEIVVNDGVAINNTLKRGNLHIIKTFEGKEQGMAGVEFRITCAELGFDEIYVTDESGKIIINNLLPSWYTVEELAGDKNIDYVLAAPQTVSVMADETVTVEVYNTLIPKAPLTGDDFLFLWGAILFMLVSAVGAVIAFKTKQNRG